MKTESDINRYRFPVAAASGLLLTLAFPKTGHPLFALFAIVPLLTTLRSASFPEAFRLGFTAGVVHFVSLVYWTAYTMKIYGHLPLYLCVPLLILLSAYLAVYPALFAGLTVLIRKPGLLPLFIPVFWTASEYLRATLFTGFPWELLGYSQYRSLHFIQIADIAGIYSVSFWLVLINTAFFLAFSGFKRQRWQAAPVSVRSASGAILSALVISGLLWTYGQWRITAIDRKAGQAMRKKITVVQGNIDQNKKWNRTFQKSTLMKYNTLSLPAGRKKPDLVVWPETATPFFIGHNRPMTELLVKGIRRTGTDYLIGAPTVTRYETRSAYHNSALLFDHQARAVDSYDKVHLVPFGEYVPFKKWLPFLGKMVAQVGDFVPGEKGRAIRWKKVNLGVQICYEIIFPDLSRAMVQNGAGILINITNDAWFGKTGAPRQHFSMAVFRAIENRRSLARAANTGISGFIGPAGRIIKASKLNTATALTQVLPVMKMTAFYTDIGDLFALLCLIVTLFISGRALFNRYLIRKT